MFPIVVGVPVLPVVPVVVAPRFQGWVGFAPAWETYMDWMEEYEYLIWHRWQRMIACRHLSVIERRRMLIELIQRDNRYESSKRIDRLADRMLGMEEDLGADEWGHVVREETTTTTTTTSAQQQQQHRREQEEEHRMNVRRVNAANGLVDAAKESGNQDIASLRRTQEIILAGQMDDLVIAQEEEQKISQLSGRRRAIMSATSGPSNPVPALTAPPTPGTSTPRRLQGRLNAGGHSFSSQSLQHSFEAPMPQAQQAPMPQPLYQPQPAPPAPAPLRPAPQSTTYHYNQQQFQQSVQNPPPAPFATNQDYQQGVKQYKQSTQQKELRQSQQQQQQTPILAEKSKRPKDRETRSSKRHRHHTQTVTTTTVTTSNTTSEHVEEDDQSQYPGPQYGHESHGQYGQQQDGHQRQQYGQQQYGQQPFGRQQYEQHPYEQQQYGNQQSAPPPQLNYTQPRQITQSVDFTPANFLGQMQNQPVPPSDASSNPGGYPIPNPASLVQNNDFDQAKKKKKKKKEEKKERSKTAVLAGSGQVAGQKGQGEKKKKKTKKYDEL
ncbi:hypothetical protein KC343_g5999 [Hortaea werneckii]|uniref:Uncharacterized protein n=1 Tax=Hortaea werneckii TaxID=91943 RepID=A0A3M7H026_HORWE|nr:hypothetical protein KC352_g17914 [Hortaea werneckii]KAI7560185.1 hypothetical protein KC317_g9880 [Hortaea werneckii]KAI7608013.1 hypothetical protein KC346_g9801 [Hortaea werneckii]KAI7627429.1 hypothetical protein KC343_g5999 [Hortaea werneckii]KAI7654678.1 hypothetical protein KC319_g10206 [Hortaea werneckii]